MDKKFYRCVKCNAVFNGIAAPARCPDCDEESFFAANPAEAKMLLFSNENNAQSSTARPFSEIELAALWDSFARKNECVINPHKSRVSILARAVLDNERRTGFKSCPSPPQDIGKKLLCPCDFKKQKCWEAQKSCWCGLFMKREDA
ncbi:MAG TPA: ferredoxin-thioredoxin reductase catalytic domain-containing protein [Candidatus Nanoarchaeia archaeon]|nr:ferredoxin-thioredoxin reductase catalytic domain-containing protein [Candidatus Nanoarchaeia archaeon]